MLITSFSNMINIFFIIYCKLFAKHLLTKLNFKRVLNYPLYTKFNAGTLSENKVEQSRMALFLILIVVCNTSQIDHS